MNENQTDAVASNAELGLLPIGPHDHPEPQTMVWSDLELRAIKAYAGRCVAAEFARLTKALRNYVITHQVDDEEWDREAAADRTVDRILSPN